MPVLIGVLSPGSFVAVCLAGLAVHTTVAVVCLQGARRAAHARRRSSTVTQVKIARHQSWSADAATAGSTQSEPSSPASASSVLLSYFMELEMLQLCVQAHPCVRERARSASGEPHNLAKLRPWSRRLENGCVISQIATSPSGSTTASRRPA